jgi:hypothetical protein
MMEYVWWFLSRVIGRQASCITVDLAVACVSMMLALLEARPPPSVFRQTRKIPHHASGFESKKDITNYTSILVASAIYHYPLRLPAPTHNTHKMRPTQMLMGGGGGKPGK